MPSLTAHMRLERLAEALAAQPPDSTSSEICLRFASVTRDRSPGTMPVSTQKNQVQGDPLEAGPCDGGKSVSQGRLVAETGPSKIFSIFSHFSFSHLLGPRRNGAKQDFSIFSHFSKKAGKYGKILPAPAETCHCCRPIRAIPPCCSERPTLQWSC